MQRFKWVILVSTLLSLSDSFAVPSVRVPSQKSLSTLDSIQPQFEKSSKVPSFEVFLTSTEMQISRAKPIIDQAPEGLYVTVGAERGFRAASMSPRVTQLLLLDISPKVIRYNKINIELLKASSLEEYKRLRWHSSLEAWLDFAKNTEKKLKTKVVISKDDFEWWNKNVRDLDSYSYYPLPEMLNRFGKDILVDRFLEIQTKLEKLMDEVQKAGGLVTRNKVFYTDSFEEWNHYGEKVGSNIRLSVDEWTWWRKYVGNGKDYAYAQEWSKDPKFVLDYGKIIDFKSGNYLYHPALFEKLHRMVLKNQIATLLVDLSIQKNVSVLVSHLKSSGLSLSVLDLDNSYDSYYMGEQAYMAVVNEMTKVAKPASILLVMRNFKEYASGQFSIYLGFQFENVRRWPATFHLPEFFKKVPHEVIDLMNGRLFEVGEMPPTQFF
jgi:hypothetical protein